jgi:hypothetical protein
LLSLSGQIPTGRQFPAEIVKTWPAGRNSAIIPLTIYLANALALRGPRTPREGRRKAVKNRLGTHDVYEKKGVSQIGKTSPNPYLIRCKGLSKSAGSLEPTMCMKTQGLIQNSRNSLKSYLIKFKRFNESHQFRPRKIKKIG